MSKPGVNVGPGGGKKEKKSEFGKFIYYQLIKYKIY